VATVSDDRADAEATGDGDDPEADGETPGTDAEARDADDWFERALRETEDSDEDLFSGEWSPDAVDAESDDHDPARNASFESGADGLESAFADIAEDERSVFDAESEDASPGDAGEPDEDTDPDATRAQTVAGDEAESEEDAPAKDEDAPAEEDGDGDSLFDSDFASALGEAPDLPSESGGGGFDDPSGGPGDFGGGGGEFGGSGGEFGGGGGEFDMATDDVGALGDLDDVGPPGGGGADFEQPRESHESEIPRIELGVDGLDAMIQGGVPERSLMVAIGSAGTGKTTLGLQFLDRGLQQGERAVYITLEESRERVIRSATEKGFAYDEYAEAGQLAVVDIDPIEMANSLQSIRSELPRLIRDFGASRLVLDSVSLLEMMYDDRAVRRNEIYDFTRSLKDAGVTTLLTSEASEESAFASRHGIVEYLTDAVFVLQYVRPSDFRETRLAIEIQKIRDANHSRETKPYEITNEGINVYRQANIF